jgi:hypothetical protein
MNNTKSQARIRQHLKAKGRETKFEITPSLCLYWWRIMNKAVFESKLRQPKEFICKSFRQRTLGWCEIASQRKKTVRIGISTDMKFKRGFLTVLVHEMVHQYEVENGFEMKHGKVFYSWKKPIKEFLNLNLSRNTSIYE